MLRTGELAGQAGRHKGGIGRCRFPLRQSLILYPARSPDSDYRPVWTFGVDR